VDTVLQAPLTTLKGVGVRLAEKFKKLHLYQISHLLFHFPTRYQDRTKIHNIGESVVSQEWQFFVQVDSSEITFGRKRMLVVHVSDDTGHLSCRFFNFSAALKNQFAQGKHVLLFGQLQQGKHGLEMLHPEFKITTESDLVLSKGSTPVYALTEGISQNLMRNSVQHALDCLQNINEQDYLSDKIIKQFSLPSFKTALLGVHHPKPASIFMDILNPKDNNRKRLVIEEILAHQIRQQAISDKLFSKLANPFTVKHDVIDDFYNRLTFKPTRAQLRVIKEIETDMAKDKAMLRLLQGDVGAGKTVVAAVVALSVIASGFQVALMAPTEILAEQHYQSFQEWFTPFGIQTALLKGKLKASDKKSLLGKLAQGEIQFVVGTHALIQDDVTFKKQGLAIIDEQHRFGVLQRKTLVEKGQHKGRVAHQLVMTATPIPRTLAMTAYADLQVSIIDELPLGRKPVTTFAMSQSRREEILQKIKNHCTSGQQVYWVCTLIEESEFLQNQTAEETYQLLVQNLASLNIGLIHGRMKTDQKESIMQQFKNAKLNILVSTTVIEVGVNVPNATLMVIEDADRLGLAQLHQLRGRVGRGQDQSYCALLFKAPLSDAGKQRLGIMRETTDGFIIAEKDLQIRGPGEYMGTRQTGQLQFKITNLETDEALIESSSKYKTTMMKQSQTTRNALIERWIVSSDELINA